MGRNRGKKKTNHRLEALERGKQAAFEELAHNHNSNSKNNIFQQNSMNRPWPTQSGDHLPIHRPGEQEQENLRPQSPEGSWVYEEENLDSELIHDEEENPDPELVQQEEEKPHQGLIYEEEKPESELVQQEEEQTDSDFESSVVTVALYEMDPSEEQEIDVDVSEIEEIVDDEDLSICLTVNDLIEEVGLDEAVQFMHNQALNQFEERGSKNAALLHDELCHLLQLGNIETVRICCETLTNPVIMYNIAAMRFYNRMYAEAYSVVRRLMYYKDGTDVISLKTRMLYISILMEAKDIDKTLREIRNFESLLGALEKAPSDKTQGKKRKKVLYVLPENDLEISLRLSLQKKKVICFLRKRNLVEAKKEYKTCVNLDNSVPKEGRTPEIIYLISLQAHLKAYIEFLSGRPDKALNLVLGLAFGYDVDPPLGLWSMSTPHNQETFWATGDNLDIMLNNNAACCYLAMKKNCVASWYLKIACDACDNPELKDKSRLPIQCLRYNRKYEAMYNYTLSSLRSHHYYRAFYYGWVISRRAYAKYPSLWLHLAEACIYIHDRRAKLGAVSEEGLFEPLNEFRHNCPVTGVLLPFPEVPPTPSVAYGLECIKRALKLIRPTFAKHDKGLQDTFQSQSKLARKNWHRIANLRARLLVTGAYLAWVGGRYKRAVNYGRKVFDMFDVPGIYHCLSQTYWFLSLEKKKQHTKALNLYSDARDENYSFLTPGLPPLIRGGDNTAGQNSSKTIRATTKVKRLSGRQNVSLALARHAFIYNHALSLVHAKAYTSANIVLQNWLTLHREAAKVCQPLLLAKFEYLADVVQRILRLVAIEMPQELRKQKPVIRQSEHHKLDSSQSSSSKANPASSRPTGPKMPKRTKATPGEVKVTKGKTGLSGSPSFSSNPTLDTKLSAGGDPGTRPFPSSSTSTVCPVHGTDIQKPNRKSNRARKS